jgi:hypothetical protein
MHLDKNELHKRKHFDQRIICRRLHIISNPITLGPCHNHSFGLVSSFLTRAEMSHCQNEKSVPFSGARRRSCLLAGRRGSRCGLFRVVTRHIFRPSARQSIKTVVTCLCFVPPPPPSPRRLTGALLHCRRKRERERHASSEPEREKQPLIAGPPPLCC